jgi:hypothetical protein
MSAAVPVYVEAMPTDFWSLVKNPVSATMSMPRLLDAEVLHNVLAQDTTHKEIGVPLRRVEQPLDSRRVDLSYGLGHLPAVLALHPSQQADEVAADASLDLRAGEAVAYSPMRFPNASDHRPKADSSTTPTCETTPSLTRLTGRID